MGTRMNNRIVPTGLLTILSLCGISTSCPSVCSCNGNQTDCSDINHLVSISSLLDQLPSDLTFLTLSRNNFTNVEPKSFSNLSILLHLDLSRNLLSTLHPSSFSQLTSLKVLDLSENLLVTLPVELFSDLGSLAELVLRDNRLTELNPDQFKGLTELKRLDLSLNNLTSLPAYLLDGLQKLVWLSLVGNKLRTLQRDSLELAPALQHLLLEGNPWNCSCKLIPLKSWLEWILYRGGRVDSVNCSYPTSLHGKDLQNIPTEMFRHCYPLYLQTRSPSTAEGQPAPAGPTGDCVRQRYRPVSVRRAVATVVVAGVVCGVVCVLMVVSAAYGCIYATLAAHEQQRLIHGDTEQPSIAVVTEPEQDLMKGLMPSVKKEAEVPDCAAWMAFPPEVCV